jgi:hypothetical protein
MYNIDVIRKDHGDEVEVLRAHLDDTTLVGPVATLLEIYVGVSTFGALGSRARSVMAILVNGIVHGRLIPPEIARFYISRLLIGHILANIGVSLSQALAIL